MARIYKLAIDIALFLSTSYLLVQSLPIKYHQRNSGDRTRTHPYTQNNPLKNISNSRQFPQERLEKEYNAGKSPPALGDQWAMFSKIVRNVQHPIEGRNKMLPKAARPTTAGHPRSESSSSASTEKETEMTISLPDYKTDIYGKTVFSYQKGPDEDVENLKLYMRGSPIKQRGPVAQMRSFQRPATPFHEVCFGSTVYNFPKQIRFLKQRIYHRSFNVRPVWLDLREEIYKDGNSQECHKHNLTDWKKYILCAIMRNMRMEYLIPKYPLHQHGGYFFPRNYWVDEHVWSPWIIN